MTISLAGLDMSFMDDWKPPKKERLHLSAMSKRSSFPSPQVVRDFADPVFSQVDGQHYTSKKHYRDHLKAHNMIEMGNEKFPERKEQAAITESDIALAYEQCEQGAGAKASDLPDAWEGDPVKIAAGEDG
jgi:hypothetical protein